MTYRTQQGFNLIINCLLHLHLLETCDVARGVDEKLIWPVCPQVCYCAAVGQIDQGAACTHVSVHLSPE